MKNFVPQATTALLIALLIAACSSAAAADTDFNTKLARAAELKKPLVVLIAESGQSKADDDAIKFFESKAVKTMNDRAVIVVLDISVSRNRAEASRFHALETPLLLCLTPRGVIASRDEKSITQGTVLQRIEQVVRQSPELDAKFAALESAAHTNTNDTSAQFQFTDFLLSRHNAIEAIPTLANIAHSETNAPDARFSAWLALVCAHFWIAEPEKARHEAEIMMATLGDAIPEARAAGQFVLGSQDATNAKRIARARTEFEAAVAAAPNSSYGKQAAEALAKLPKEEQLK